MSQRENLSNHLKTAIIAGIFAITATCIIEVFLLTKTLLEKCLGLVPSTNPEQERPITRSEEKETTSASETPSSSAFKELLQRGKEAVAIWGGLVGLFVAVLWMTGRSYARGYFEAMSIPHYYVKFSIWEYGESSWQLLLLGSAILCVFVSVSIGVLRWIYLHITQLMREAVKQLDEKTNKSNLFHLAEIVPALPVILFGGAILMTSMNMLLNWAHDQGMQTGSSIVVGKGTRVEFVSDTPLQLGTPTITSTSIGDETVSLFVYQDFRLLTFNEGHYYVFRRIDPTTCRPERVYIVEEDQFVQAQLAPAPALPRCTPQVWITPVSPLSPTAASSTP